jgi:hypothetical protein
MEFKYRKRPLRWTEVFSDAWQANSRYHDGGCAFLWRIDKNDDGVYEIGGSEAELISALAEEPNFDTLEDAKAWCETEEAFAENVPWVPMGEVKCELHFKLGKPHVRLLKGVLLYPPASFEVFLK